jgi:hypothetical protein
MFAHKIMGDATPYKVRPNIELQGFIDAQKIPLDSHLGTHQFLWQKMWANFDQFEQGRR